MGQADLRPWGRARMRQPLVSDSSLPPENARAVDSLCLCLEGAEAALHSEPRPRCRLRTLKEDISAGSTICEREPSQQVRVTHTVHPPMELEDQ